MTSALLARHRVGNKTRRHCLLLLLVLAASLGLSGCDDNPLSCANPQSTGTWPFDMKWCTTDDNGNVMNPYYYNGPFQNPWNTTLKDANAQNLAHDVTMSSRWYDGFQMMSYNTGAAFTGVCTGSEGSVDDGDFCFDVRTPWLAGLNQQNTLWTLHCEVLQSDSIDNFTGNPWWKAVHDNNAKVVDGMFKNNQVMITGIWAMDFGHDESTDGYAELHPVMTFAMQTVPPPSKGGTGNETWQFFARRQCDNNHGTTWTNPETGFTFRFPLSPGAGDAFWQDAWTNGNCSGTLHLDGNDLLLTLNMPAESDWVCGTLVIPYKGVTPTPTPDTQRVQRMNKMLDELGLTPKTTKELLNHVRGLNTQVTKLSQSSTKLTGAHAKAYVGLKKTTPQKDRVKLFKVPYDAHLTEVETAHMAMDREMKALIKYVNDNLSPKQRNILAGYFRDELSVLKSTGAKYPDARHPKHYKSTQSAVTKKQRKEAHKKMEAAKAAGKYKAPVLNTGKKLPKIVLLKTTQKPPLGKVPTGPWSLEKAHSVIEPLPSRTTMRVMRELFKDAEGQLAILAKKP